MPDDDVYIVHMGHPTDPFDYGTACGAPWPDGPGPLDPGLVIPPEGIRVDPPAHLRPRPDRRLPGVPADCARVQGDLAADPGQQQLVMVHRLLEAEDRLPKRTPRADPRYRQQAPSARLTEPVQ
jgi:hypothetical protein